MIYINARFLTQPITGVQRFSIEISKKIKELCPSVQFVSPQKIIHHNLALELNAIRLGKLDGHLWEQIELPIYLKSQKKPLLINLANTAPLLYGNKISTIHDIAFERYPESFSWKFRSTYKFIIPRIARSSISIITVSEFSRKEIADVYKINPNKIKLIYNSAGAFFKKSNTTKKPYILAVSSITQQKNFHGLIDAFLKIKSTSHELLMVGGINRSFADSKLLKKIDSNPRIRFTGRVSDEELVDLYSQASAFVYPSFYEGFGIPPLEAQACGCPVICSNAASLPEVCGDSALYFSPHDTSDIATKIDLLLSNREIAEELVAKGYKNIQRFSWEASAKKLLEIAKEAS